jgi:hypothetical protein
VPIDCISLLSGTVLPAQCSKDPRLYRFVGSLVFHLLYRRVPLREVSRAIQKHSANSTLPLARVIHQNGGTGYVYLKDRDDRVAKSAKRCACPRGHAGGVEQMRCSPATPRLASRGSVSRATAVVTDDRAAWPRPAPIHGF